MKTIIINASAAKTGGAETILRTFVDSLRNFNTNQFIVLSPHKFDIEEQHLNFHTVMTNGFESVYFSTIGIKKFVKKYKPIKIVSFNNLNYIFQPSKGITYFHQPKALEAGYTDLKVKVYRFIITKFLKKNSFIVQSKYIKQKFLKVYGLNSENVKFCWPGFTILKPESISNIDFSELFKYKGILPIAYAAEHKNVKLLDSLIDFFQEKSIQVTTLLDSTSSIFDSNSNAVRSIGAISRPQMFWLYENVDFMIFTSKDETVGLPIFEFLQTGKPAFVYSADYAKEFYKQFDEPKNFILFEDAAHFKKLFVEKIKVREKNTFNYEKGEWHKILDLL